MFYRVTVVHHNDSRAQFSPVIEQILGPATSEYLVECDEAELMVHLANCFQQRFGMPLTREQPVYPYVSDIKCIEMF